MLDHFIQREIVYQLRFADSLRFSDLQPEGIDNKLFSYHLKKVLVADLVEKTEDGKYKLTSLGQKIGESGGSQRHHIERAYSIILIAVRDSKNGWLLLRRNSHPMRSLTGLLQATPEPGISPIVTAQQSLHRQTSLTASFSVAASGLMTIRSQGSVESFINITLLLADSAQGAVHQSESSRGDIFWEKHPDWRAPNMAPSLGYLIPLLDEPGLSLIDTVIDR